MVTVLVHKAAFLLAGYFFVNGLPHLVQGLSGKRWPVKSRLLKIVERGAGRGGMIAHPVANALWGLGNLAAAYALIAGNGHFTGGLSADFAALLAGAVIGALVTSWTFAGH